MKYTVLYFSGTGNTWFVADTISKEIGDQCHCYSIENSELDFQKIIRETDHLFLGYPIYGSEAPEPMKRFISALEKQDNPLPTSVFVTEAYASGDGANYLRDVLEKKNYILKNSLEVKMSNNFYVPIFIKAFPVGDADKKEKRHEKARNRVETWVRQILDGEKALKKIYAHQKWLGNTQRKHIGDYIKKVNEALYADDSCTKCGLCVRLCPMENIVLEDKVMFKDQCASCMRCYHACPVSAIQITAASQDLKQYPRYKGPTKDFKFVWLKK
ncbi:MAG: EFR1 family ferrodoxin [Clostridia bacterium]|nr:EFR1 family ferrodoxin [Clostridia bacterium]